MPEGLTNAGRLEFKECLAEGPLAVRVAGFATGGEGDGDRRVGKIPVIADDIDVRETELIGGEFRQRADTEIVETVEHRPVLGTDPVEIEHDALVEGAEQQPVAVTLKQFEQAVAQGKIDVRPGAETVRDQVCERLVAFRQLEIIGGRDVEGASARFRRCAAGRSASIQEPCPG